MSAFATKGFNANRYLSLRPTPGRPNCLRPGIFTTDLAREFDSVIGVDLSPSMIASAQESAHARDITNVEYKVGTGESLPIESNSGVHWFKFDTFLDEALRVLKPGGTMALVGYKYPEVVGDTTRSFVNRLAFDEQYLLKYWDDGYKLVEGGYQPLVAPVMASAFENVRYVGYPEVWKQRIPEIEVLPEAWIDQRQSTLEELAGYFKTWSTLTDTVAIDYPQFAIVARKPL
ncbi:S-adenosyl-L-methionine-dependent methyltransferase [Linderina pennispora]|uniref:S-adenosyl-L-methionine-dependent methyltransferase n=1 Tax=Linderina pennispora TaxID=61395 RepID=A0A1Y1VQN8_9FUNG|nr:S-adenosyl-L-methionine-dependent methyltransferase [Linderina pennispora]ORX63346.1 S-adenosyl-L-methionine-dependent methyltransferase [Linderina pennispora]